MDSWWLEYGHRDSDRRPNNYRWREYPRLFRMQNSLCHGSQRGNIPGVDGHRWCEHRARLLAQLSRVRIAYSVKNGNRVESIKIENDNITLERETIPLIVSFLALRFKIFVPPETAIVFEAVEYCIQFFPCSNLVSKELVQCKKSHWVSSSSSSRTRRSDEACVLWHIVSMNGQKRWASTVHFWFPTIIEYCISSIVEWYESSILFVCKNRQNFPTVSPIYFWCWVSSVFGVSY